MRKKKFVVFMLLAAMTLALPSCGKSSGQTPAKQEIVGGDSAVEAITYTVSGAEDIHLRETVSAYDFGADAQLRFSNGRTEAMVCDASAVRLGQPGAYDIIYSHEKVTVSKKAFVYGVPEFIFPKGDLLVGYSQVYSALTEGFSAKDTFGNPLEVFLLEDDGLFNTDGTANAGEFSVVYAAVDRVGHRVTTEKKITVSTPTGSRPTIDAHTVYDVIQDEVRIGIDLKDGLFAGVSIDNGLLERENYLAENGILTIPGDYLCEKAGIGEHTIRVITSQGAAEGTLQVEDREAPAVDTVGLNGWIFEAGKPAVLPVPKKVHERQNFTLDFMLYDPDGAELTVDFPAFTPEKTGSYTLKAIAKRPGEQATEFPLAVHVRSAEELKTLYWAGDSMQFAEERIQRGGDSEGSELSYSEKEIGGKRGSWKLTSHLMESPWYARVDFVGERMTTEPFGDYEYIVFDMFLEQDMDLVAWGKDVYYLRGWSDNFRIFDYEKNEYKNADKSDYVGKWVKVMIRVGNYTEDIKYREVRFGMKAQGSLYMRNFRFE